MSMAQAFKPATFLMGLETPLPSWEPALAKALDKILSRPPAGVSAFRRTAAYAAEYGQRLKDESVGAVSVKTEGRFESHPLPVTILNNRPNGSGGCLDATLLWLLLEMHLWGIHADSVKSLASSIRGLTAPSSQKKLSGTIGECDGLLHLIRKLKTLKSSPVTPDQVTGHEGFDSLWKNSLEAICHSLLQQSTVDTEPDEEASGGHLLGDPLVEPASPVATEAAEDPEEGPFHSMAAIAPDKTPPSAWGRLAEASGKELYRRSSPDLLRDPETVAPSALLAREWCNALALVQQGWKASNATIAEAGLLRLLAIETGLVEREAISAAFGNRTTEGGIAVIDLHARALRRPERRPQYAFTPKPGDPAWLATGGDVLFPLSREAVAAAIQVRRLRRRNIAIQPTSLLVASTSGQSGLRKALNGGDSAPAPASACRLRLAATLAENLGPDAAQDAFGDTFGMASSPTFYSAFQASDIARCITQANHAFTKQDTPSPRCIRACDHHIGSRARPITQPYSDAWDMLGVSTTPRRGRPARKDIFESLRRKRDALAVHLLLAIGHRPNPFLADIRLPDFIPRAALVVLFDKRVDPAHATRIACTGWRFVGALENYVIELRRIARDPDLGQAQKLARSILRGEASIFSIPTAAGRLEDIGVMELMAMLPQPWASKPNLHRHGLCQALIERGVDPELRYFQLGWLACDVHATSDAAPYPPVNLGIELAGIIDSWLLEVGWLGGNHPIHPESILMSGKLRDWGVERKLLQTEVENRARALRAELAEKRHTETPKVLAVLGKQVAKLLPEWQLAKEKGRPVLVAPKISAEGGDLPVIGEATVRAILAPFGDFGAMQEYIARRELASLLTKAVKAKKCRAYIPAVQVLSTSRISSPFIRNLGCAVEQSCLLRARILECAKQLEDLEGTEKATQLAVLSIWSIAASTPYRDLERASSLVNRLTERAHAKNEDWLLRVPSPNGHAILSGEPAILLQRLMGTEGWELAVKNVTAGGPSLLGKFVKTKLPELCPEDLSATEAANQMCSALVTAGTIELEGPSRLIMDLLVIPATTSATRAASMADRVTVPGENANTGGADPTEEQEAVAGNHHRNPSHRPMRRIDDLMRMFNPDYNDDIRGKPALPAEHRVRQLLPLVNERLEKLGGLPTLCLLALEYVHQLMTCGGPRTTAGMKISTIYKIYHHISPALRAVSPEQDMELLTEEELTGILMASFAMARRRSSADALASIRSFIEFSALRYDIAIPDWNLLGIQAGERILGKDPALVSDDEAERVISELQENVEALSGGNHDPQERRCRELQFIGALIMESSAARPRSIHGLTLADIHMYGDAHFIHLRTRGRYASIKTTTSAGFIRLEGKIWHKHSEWVARWLEAQQSTFSPDAWSEVPLFQMPGQPLGIRYPIRKIFDRIGELARWSTQQPHGRAYWFRKRRVACRHRAVARPDARARDVGRAMKANGHVLLVTPLGHYVGELMAIAPPHLGNETTTRSVASNLSGLNPSLLDQRWRSKAKNGASLKSVSCEARMASILALPIPRWSAPPLPEPPAYQPFRDQLSWKSIGDVMSQLAESLPSETIGKKLGIEVHQIEAIKARCGELERRTGLELGTDTSQLHRPRSTRFVAQMEKLLVAEDDRLSGVADEWVRYAHACRPEDGCALYNEAHMSTLRGLMAECGLSLEERAGKGGLQLFKPKGDDGGGHYGVWWTLKWALTVAWVATLNVED
jgi:hypothetical protein